MFSLTNAKKGGIESGQIATLIRHNQLIYAVFLDEYGIKGVIGEASVATAKLLGIDSDPRSGRTDEAVTHFVFAGKAVASPIRKIMPTTPRQLRLASSGPRN